MSVVLAFFQAVSHGIDSIHMIKKSLLCNDEHLLAQMVTVCTTALQISQKYQVQGKSYLRGEFCICQTLLHKISWIASC